MPKTKPQPHNSAKQKTEITANSGEKSRMKNERIFKMKFVKGIIRKDTMHCVFTGNKTNIISTVSK